MSQDITREISKYLEMNENEEATWSVVARMCPRASWGPWALLLLSPRSSDSFVECWKLLRVERALPSTQQSPSSSCEWQGYKDKTSPAVGSHPSGRNTNQYIQVLKTATESEV